MNLSRKITSALLALISLINLTACDNSYHNPPIDITFPDITPPPVTVSQPIQTTEPEETVSSKAPVIIAPEYEYGYGEAQAHYTTKITYKMTEEDKEVKNIIDGIYRKSDALIDLISHPENMAREFITHETPISGSDLNAVAYKFFVNEEEYNNGDFYKIYAPMMSLDYPMISNLDDLKEQLLFCFTEEITDSILSKYTMKCEKLAQKGDNLFLVKRINGCDKPEYAQIIEMDGIMYCAYGGSGLFEQMCSSFDQIRVLEKTDERIIFAYISVTGLDQSISAAKGVLQKESDGWKFAWYCTTDNYDLINFKLTWLS